MSAVKKKPMYVRDFQRLVNNKKNAPPNVRSVDELENMFWNTLTDKPKALYRAGYEATLCDEYLDILNIPKIKSTLDILKDNDIIFSGVNTPHIYFGSWKTTFPFHTEDMDLPSLNYLHSGTLKHSMVPEMRSSRRCRATTRCRGSTRCRASIRCRGSTRCRASILQDVELLFYKM